MEIHDLNTKALTDPAYVAFDDGTDTYKTEFNDVVADAAADAVASADLTDNMVAFTSGDSASPTGWTAVDVLTSGLSLKTLFNRISTMVKNVRYIWNLLGSSSFSNVASTLTGAIGNTALTTTAQTLSGAIVEHESDISTLNSKIGAVVTGTTLTTTATAKTTVHVASMTLPAGTWVVCTSVQFTSSFTEVAMLNISNTGYVSAVARGNGVNGGGLASSVILELASSTTMYMDVNQQHASDIGINQIQFRAVRIK